MLEKQCGEKRTEMEEKLDKKSTAATLYSEPRSWWILGILILIAALGGCIGKDDKAGVLPVQNTSGEKVTLGQDSPTQGASVNISGQQINNSDPQSNQLRLILRSKGLNKSSNIPVTLQLMNPRLNETVITVFKPQSGQEWYNQTNITHIANNNWTQSYSIKRVGNISYVRMYVQVSENNEVVRRAAWNITFEAPGDEPK